MKTKHVPLFTLVMLTAILVLSGWSIKPEKTEIREETVPPPTEEPAKVYTEADLIEYFAQTSYLQLKYAEDPIKFGEEISKLNEKSPGIFEQFTTWMDEWDKKLENDPVNTEKQWEEMMKKVTNRIYELSKGN